MKLFKLFLDISIVVFLSLNALGQPMLDIPLYATDGTYTIPIAVGLDPTATNGIDPQLGESDLPPFPPVPAFEIRFDLTWLTGENLSTYKDYRYASNPYWGEVQHKLLWQVNTYILNIQYNFPNGVFMYLRDSFGGGLFNLGPFYGQGIATIPVQFVILNQCLLLMEYWMPVELTSFTASVLQNEKAIQLNWTTATETNNSGFEILRKAQNDNDWETIGFVPGFGTTTEPKSYSFIDENVTIRLAGPSAGIYKYRLKQIDFDGTIEYSNEIEVEVDFTPKEFVLYQNYPNPFNPNTVISYQLPVTSDVTLKIYDILGNEVATLVNEEKQLGVYEVEFDASSLSSGMYLYKFQAGDFVQTKKMILLR